jgi:hypothetical protein
MANVLGLCHMCDNFHVTFDNWKEEAFLVHTEKGIAKFKRTPEGLYACEPPQGYIKEVAEDKGLCAVETVD